MRALAIGLFLIVLGGCAVSPEQHVLREAGTGVELTQVPFFAQDDYQCGPAALATILVDAGVDVTPERLVSRIYVPGRRGSLQTELLAATRSHGRVPYVLPGSLAAMLAELRAGRPVLVLQNLGFDRWPVWHYAVLIGFDSRNEKFLLRSGTTHREQSRARPFLASWERAGRWSMVAVSASDPPVSAEVLGWLRAIAPFESIGNLEMAAEGYEAGVARWPEEALAWTALGNVRYLQRDLKAAETAYKRALALSPELWPARNNLVRTMIARGCPNLAQQWVAGAGVPPVEFTPIWSRTLSDLAETAEESCSGKQIADQ